MTGEPTILFCVGATKAGTSWLYRHLRTHGDCALRTIKELHYFDTLESGRYRAQAEGHVQRLMQREEESGGLRQSILRIQDTGDWLKVLDRKGYDRQAYLDYLMGRLEGRKLVGDLTPSYALLPEARLEQMQGLGTKTRFVYLMRDPVARLWSHLRMQAGQGAATQVGKRAAELAEKMLKGGLGGIAERGDYAKTVALLRRVIEPARLMLLRFEEMLTPAGLRRLCDFLGIATRADAEFGRPIHPGQGAELPVALCQRLRAMLAPQYEFAAREFGGLPSGWMAAEGVA